LAWLDHTITYRIFKKEMWAKSSLGKHLSSDADMELMHRHKMGEVITSVLAVADSLPRLMIGVGTGTGFLIGILLRIFPGLKIIAIDGAQQMVEVARIRLGSLAARVDFRELGGLCRDVEAADAIVSAYALHHLSVDEKRRLLRAARDLLRSGGWFLNAEVAPMEDDELEAVAQGLRVRGIVSRNNGRDPWFADEGAVRRFLDDLERNEGDRPLLPADDLRLLHEAGFSHISTFWREAREAVWREAIHKNVSVVWQLGTHEAGRRPFFRSLRTPVRKCSGHSTS
jgi:SAM-dependent methyltransferase